MKCFIVLSALVAVALAKPGYLLAPNHVSHVLPLAYAKLVPGAPLGPVGRVVDTPEVAHAKAEHAAAHINEKTALAHESVKSADLLTYAAAPAPVTYLAKSYASVPVAVSSYQAVAPAVAYAKYVPAAPLGVDGRVVDTPEVAYAKAEHAAAHINEKINLAQEEVKSHSYAAPQVQLVSAYSVGSYAPQYIAAQPW